MVLTFICCIMSVVASPSEETVEMKLVIAGLKSEFTFVCDTATRMMAPDKISARYLVKEYFTETVCKSEISGFQVLGELFSEEFLQTIERFDLEMYLALQKLIDTLLNALETADSRFFCVLPEANPLKVASGDFFKSLLHWRQVVLVRVNSFSISTSIWDESKTASVLLLGLVVDFENIIKKFVKSSDLSMFPPLVEFKRTTMKNVESNMQMEDLNFINEQQKKVTISYTELFHMIHSLQNHVSEVLLKDVKSLGKKDPRKIGVLTLQQELTTLASVSESAFEEQKHLRRKILKFLVDQSRARDVLATAHIEVTNKVLSETASQETGKRRNRKKKSNKSHQPASVDAIDALATRP